MKGRPSHAAFLALIQSYQRSLQVCTQLDTFIMDVHSSASASWAWFEQECRSSQPTSTDPRHYTMLLQSHGCGRSAAESTWPSPCLIKQHACTCHSNATNSQVEFQGTNCTSWHKIHSVSVCRQEVNDLWWSSASRAQGESRSWIENNKWVYLILKL